MEKQYISIYDWRDQPPPPTYATAINTDDRPIPEAATAPCLCTPLPQRSHWRRWCHTLWRESAPAGKEIWHAHPWGPDACGPLQPVGTEPSHKGEVLALRTIPLWHEHRGRRAIAWQSALSRWNAHNITMIDVDSCAQATLHASHHDQRQSNGLFDQVRRVINRHSF